MSWFGRPLMLISIAMLLSPLVLPACAIADPIGKTVSWTANPGSVVQGKTSEVILSAPGATCGTASGQLNDTSLATPPTIHVQAGFDVSASTPNHSGTCELTVTLVVANAAKTGPLRLTIMGDLGYATITVTSSQASPIPDGLAPQVWMSWDIRVSTITMGDVLPTTTTRLR
jgi:hypothetical protein